MVDRGRPLNSSVNGGVGGVHLVVVVLVVMAVVMVASVLEEAGERRQQKGRPRRLRKGRPPPPNNQLGDVPRVKGQGFLARHRQDRVPARASGTAIGGDGAAATALGGEKTSEKEHRAAWYIFIEAVAISAGTDSGGPYIYSE